MGGAKPTRRRPASPAVTRYIHAVSDDRRRLFLRLEALILEAIPHGPVAIAYGVPTYGTHPARVGLGYWKAGVSFYPYSGSALDGFRRRHPTIKTTKGSVNFRLTDRLPVGDLRLLIRRALERRRS